MSLGTKLKLVGPAFYKEVYGSSCLFLCVFIQTLYLQKSSLVDNAALIFLSVWIEPRASHMPGVTAINSFLWLNIFLLKLRYNWWGEMEGAWESKAYSLVFFYKANAPT